MVLVLVLGGGLGWIVHRANVQRRAVEAIVKAGGRVSYDWQYSDGKMAPPTARSPWPKRLVDALGPDYFDDVVHVAIPCDPKNLAKVKVDDALMAHVGQLKRLDHLGLIESQESNARGSGRSEAWNGF